MSDDFPRDVCDVLSYILAVGASRAEQAFAANRLFKLLRELLRIFRAAESNVIAKHQGMAQSSPACVCVAASQMHARVLNCLRECRLAL